mmetsp:Transcript_119569/g.332465  ORF Transcript_119569/g.332465 Transcript_119569/m.332465 type:complete len:385 (+) Transcript_119569:871-2025(+)
MHWVPARSYGIGAARGRRLSGSRKFPFGAKRDDLPRPLRIGNLLARRPTLLRRLATRVAVSSLTKTRTCEPRIGAFPRGDHRWHEACDPSTTSRTSGTATRSGMELPNEVLHRRSRTPIGVCQPCVARGLVFKLSAMSSSSAWLKTLRPVPLGRYCPMSPLVFSRVPRPPQRDGPGRGRCSNSQSLNASAAGESRLPRGYTTCQRRISGNPTTSSNTNSPSASSDTTVVADSTASPRPPATVCLMASLLPTSSRVFSLTPWPAKNFSVVSRVPEPGSRKMKGSSFSRFGDRRCLPTNGWLGGATSTSGLSAKSSQTTSMFSEGWPMMYRSSWLLARRSNRFSRLHTTIATSMPGWAAQKPPSSLGTVYFTVVSMASFNLPFSIP